MPRKRRRLPGSCWMKGWTESSCSRPLRPGPRFRRAPFKPPQTKPIGWESQSLFTPIAELTCWPRYEAELMSEAGMGFRQILASLTTAPAERFGESKQVGRIAAGLQADLVILKDDPSRNLRALTAVKYTLRAGKVIYRASR